MKKIKNFITKYIAEILIVLAAFFIVLATMMINIIIGLYVTGAVFLVLGLFAASKK